MAHLTTDPESSALSYRPGAHTIRLSRRVAGGAKTVNGRSIDIEISTDEVLSMLSLIAGSGYTKPTPPEIERAEELGVKLARRAGMEETPLRWGGLRFALVEAVESLPADRAR